MSEIGTTPLPSRQPGTSLTAGLTEAPRGDVLAETEPTLVIEPHPIDLPSVWAAPEKDSVVISDEEMPIDENAPVGKSNEELKELYPEVFPPSVDDLLGDALAKENDIRMTRLEEWRIKFREKRESLRYPSELPPTRIKRIGGMLVSLF